MKKFLRNVFAGIGYLLLYLLIRELVSLVALFGFMIYTYIEAGFGAGAPMPSEAMLEARMNELLNQNLMQISVITGVLTILILFILFWAQGKKPSKETGLAKLSPFYAIVCTCLGVGLNFTLSMVMGLIPFPEEWLNNYNAAAESLNLATPFWMILATVIIAPLLEEIVFRGLLFTRFDRAMPRFLACILSSAVFGILHGDLIWFFYASVLGLVLTAVMLRCRSLWASVSLHFGFNLAGTLMGYLPESMDEATTTAFGIVVLVAAVTGLIMLILVLGGKKEETA